MDESHVFPQDVLAIYILVGSGAAIGGNRCEAVQPLDLASITALLGMDDLLSNCWSRSSRVRPKLNLLFSRVCFFPFSSLGSLPQRRGVPRQVGLLHKLSYAYHKGYHKPSSVGYLCMGPHLCSGPTSVKHKSLITDNYPSLHCSYPIGESLSRAGPV